MSTFLIENFGCRATEADASELRCQLLARGFEQTSEPAEAEYVVLNTCTVTAAADAQAREAVRKIHRANPKARIVLTGCYAQRAPEELAALEGVAFVVGNSHQKALPDLLGEAKNVFAPPNASGIIPVARLTEGGLPPTRGAAKILTGDIFTETSVWTAPTTLAACDRTRPILKIQDGCNNRCAYCVIPFVRGRSRSLPPAAVIDRVRALVSDGAREVVLSGINLGSYGRDLAPRVELNALVKRILDETSVEQLRFSSIEPQDITEDFVRLAASSCRIASHFHVPLQSGSNRILRAMHRWYRAEHYAEKIRLIRRHLPEAGIGADVIAGFTGESSEDFEATVHFVQELPFTYLHVFSFSERPGTAAAQLSERVDHRVIRDRARRLRSLGAAKSAAFRGFLAGKTSRVLTLGRGGDDWTEGLTGNYVKVRVAGRRPANQWCDVRITATAEDVLTGVPPGVAGGFRGEPAAVYS